MKLSRKEFFYYLLWSLVGVLAITVAWQLDNRVDAALDVDSKPVWIHFGQFCSKLAEGWAPGLVGIILAIVFMWLRRPAVAAKIFFVVLTCELTGLACLILRTFVGRTRPTAHVPQGIYGMWHDGHWLIGKHEFAAFPSGHTATAVGLVTAAWLVNRRWGAALIIFALMVMWARVALETHHFSDVIASAVLAIPLAVLSKKLLLPYLETQFSTMDRSLQAGYLSQSARTSVSTKPTQ